MGGLGAKSKMRSFSLLKYVVSPKCFLLVYIGKLMY